MQAPHQPVGGKRRRCAHRQDIGASVNPNPINRLAQALKALLKPGQAGLCNFGQFDPSVAPPEQTHPEQILELLDLVTDRRRRHTQLGCGLLETQVTSRCLKSTQRGQGGQIGRHLFRLIKLIFKDKIIRVTACLQIDIFLKIK
jgi:hypothetical protein